MASPIEEIIVVGSRRSRRDATFDGFRELVKKADRLGRGTPAPGPGRGRSRRKLTKVKPPKTAKKKVLEEIVSIGKLPAVKSLLRVGGVVTTAAEIGARFADKISQGRLDDSFQRFLDIPAPAVDSPLQTIPETTETEESDPIIEEIVVTETLPPELPMLDPFTFTDSVPVGIPIVNPRPGFTPEIDVPTAPELERLVGTTLENPIPATVATTDPRLFLGTGAQPAGRPVQNPVNLPSLNVGALPRAVPRLNPARPAVRPGTRGTTKLFPNAALAANPQLAKCPACPKKEKKKKEKERAACFRKLVKEARNPDDDREYKWARIDCDTGRELRDS